MQLWILFAILSVGDEYVHQSRKLGINHKLVKILRKRKRCKVTAEELAHSVEHLNAEVLPLPYKWLSLRVARMITQK